MKVNDELITKFQKLINEQFNKILKVKIGTQSYSIAVRKDEIPEIKSVRYEDDDIFISFQENIHFHNTNKEIDLITNDNGQIDGAVIKHLQKLNNEKYRLKLHRLLVNVFEEESIEKPARQVVNQHIQKRVAHAISDIINTIPETV